MTQTAIKYARALWEVNIPDETIDQMMEQYHQTPELQQVLENPVIHAFRVREGQVSKDEIVTI